MEAPRAPSIFEEKGGGRKEWRGRRKRRIEENVPSWFRGHLHHRVCVRETSLGWDATADSYFTPVSK